jgi:CBS-domain-containing membrane protein
MNTIDRSAAVTLKLPAAAIAADLMVANPISLRADANVREALVLLTDKGYSAAPVIDDAGRPVGVLSRADLLVHDRERSEHLPHTATYYYEQELKSRRGKEGRGKEVSGFEVENVDPTTVRDVMTPAVFSVAPDTPAAKVVSEMIGLHVHRLFVVDGAGVLVGVISTMDVLRHLKA